MAQQEPTIIDAFPQAVTTRTGDPGTISWVHLQAQMSDDPEEPITVFTYDDEGIVPILHEYIGLTKEQARAHAESRGIIILDPM